MRLCPALCVCSCLIFFFLVLRIIKELTPQRQLNEDAVLVVDQLMGLVQYTSVSEYFL